MMESGDDGAASLAEISQSLDRMRQQTRAVEELTRKSQEKDEHIRKLLQENARIQAELAAAGAKLKESSLSGEARIRELEERVIRSEEKNRKMDEENRSVSADLQAIISRCEDELAQCRDERDAALRKAAAAEEALEAEKKRQGEWAKARLRLLDEFCAEEARMQETLASAGYPLPRPITITTPPSRDSPMLRGSDGVTAVRSRRGSIDIHIPSLS